MGEQYLFYLNDKNILCDALNDGTGWKAGKLALSNVVCAHYSKLASITVCNNWYNFICVYYQAPTEDAAIKMISLSGYTGNWADGSPDLKDPPLFGTSLAAVQSRPGISVLTSADKDGIQQPVYYLQMDNLCLGHAQGTSGMYNLFYCLLYFPNKLLHEALLISYKDPVVMSGLELDGRSLVFSPHTSLTAVDDGSKLYIIYKSNNNSIKMIEIVDHRPNPPEKFKSIDTTPMSAIAACLSPDKKVVLFYQSLDTTTKQVHLFGCTLYKAAVNSTEWVQSTPVKLGQ